MFSNDSHISDSQLLLNVDGELENSEAARVRSHLTACWTCRVRQRELEDAVGHFVRTYHRALDEKISSPDGPRALLLARIRKMENGEFERWRLLSLRSVARWALGFATAAGVAVVALLVYSAFRPEQVRASAVTVPDPRLTPGAAVLAGREVVCQAATANNKGVPRDLARTVLREYGLAGAQTRDYEVDYLITPGLGGADDIRNLWPQSSNSAVWNAHVKDALENRLRDLVCRGDVDLTTAQREIAMNWIGAYKKYFHTELPLSDNSSGR